MANEGNMMMRMHDECWELVYDRDCKQIADFGIQVMLLTCSQSRKAT